MNAASASRRLAAAVLIAAAGTWFVSAQDAARGSVVYAEGREFSVIHAGTASLYKPEVDDLSAIQLRTGDILQTAASTFVEVQLAPSGSVIKIAENSSFMFRGLGNKGEETSLGLLYGRVRAKVAALGAKETFSIRSGQTVAGVRGTDFGFDAVIKPGASPEGQVSRPTLRVYCFEGEIELTPLAQQKTTVAVKAAELVALDFSQDVPLLERRAVDAEVSDFWRVHDFKGAPPLPAPEGVAFVSAPAETEKKPATSEIRYVAPDFRPYRSALVSKNVAVGAAIVFGGIGAALQGIGLAYIADSDYDRGKDFVYGGSVAMGTSLATLLASFFIDVKTNDSGGSR